MKISIEEMLSDSKFPEGIAWNRRRFHANEIIVKEGKVGKTLFIIEEGIRSNWESSETYNQGLAIWEKAIFLVKFVCISRKCGMPPLLQLPRAACWRSMEKDLAFIWMRVQFRGIYFTRAYSKF